MQSNHAKMCYKICLCVKYLNNAKTFHIKSSDNEKEIFSNMSCAYEVLEGAIF